MTDFDHFLAIDWSGAKGERHRGIALAVADAAGGPPVLVEPPPRGWSRGEVLGLLRDDLPPATLVGIDLGISLPFADCGAFFPGWDRSPESAKDLWALIEEFCADDPHLGAASFLGHPQVERYFRQGGGKEGDRFHAEGAASREGRFREAEFAQRRQNCRPVSNFNLVGAAQVGKSSLTGMRMLHALRGHLPVWPVDPLPGPGGFASGSLLVEIYTGLAAREAAEAGGERSRAGSKILSRGDLDAALVALGSPPVGGGADSQGAIDDHSSDALLTAAWLRKAAREPERWIPDGLTQQIAATEGWTFGAF